MPKNNNGSFKIEEVQKIVLGINSRAQKNNALSIATYYLNDKYKFLTAKRDSKHIKPR